MNLKSRTVNNLIELLTDLLGDGLVVFNIDMDIFLGR